MIGVSAPPTLTLGERRLANFAQQTRSLMMLTDLEGRILWANEAFTRTSGYNLDEAVGRTPGELLQGPGTDPKTVQRMAEALAKGRGFEAEIVNYTKEGRAYWIDLEVQPVYDDGGNIIEFVSIGHDITERKLAQVGEHQRERDALRMSMVAALTSNAVVITDAAGYIEWVNDAFIGITGYAREEVIGRRPGSILHGPETDPRSVERMRRAVIHKEPCEVEVVNYTKQGRPYWVAIEIRPIVDPASHQVSGYIAIESDITARKLAESALRKSESESRELAYVADLFDMPVAIEELDGTIRWVNEAWIKLYGYDRDTAIGRRVQELLDGPNTDRELLRKVDEACARGDPMRFAIENYREDGTPVAVIVERRPVHDERGLINRAVSIAFPQVQREPVAVVA